MEPLPTVEDIYRDEIRLDEFITADLKALVKSFRRAYERLDGVDFTSEPMQLSSSKEIRAMAVKFLEEGIAADPRTRQKEVPAANTLWVRARGSFLEYRKDRTRILGSLSRLFTRQNRYRVRHVNARGEQRPNEGSDVPPSGEDPDLPDVDDILRGNGPTQPKNRDGELLQTRSGRSYDTDSSIGDANSTGPDSSPTKFAAPVATMAKGPSWSGSTPSVIITKPSTSLTSENIKTGTSTKPTIAGTDRPAKPPSRTTTENKSQHACVISDNEESVDVSSFKKDSAFAEAIAASSDVTQDEVECIIEYAIRQMDPRKAESGTQKIPTSANQPPSEDQALNSEVLSKRKRAQPVVPSLEKEDDGRIRSTETRISGDNDIADADRAVKRPKMTDKIHDAYKVSKPQNDQSKITDNSTGPRPEESAPAQDIACILPSPPSDTASSKPGASNFVPAVRTPLGERRVKRTPGIHTNPRLASRMLFPRRKPSHRSSHLTHQGLRAHSLPPSLDTLVVVSPEAHGTSDVDERASQMVAMSKEDPFLELAPATGTESSPGWRGNREMSQTLEPEPFAQRSALGQSPTQGNVTPSPSRKSRIAVQLWILEARVPKTAWTQWAGASLNAQTVTTIFQAVDEVSQFRNADTAYVRFQTDEQVWTYTIWKDDSDHFEDMKRSITADIKATTRRNRNNNNDFKIFIEPLGGAEMFGDEAMGNVDDEVILGL